MTISNETMTARIDACFGEKLSRIDSVCGELTYELNKDDLTEVASALRDDEAFGFEQLIDVCGVDYLTYGSAEWKTNSATDSGFSRGVVREPVILDEAEAKGLGSSRVNYLPYVYAKPVTHYGHLVHQRDIGRSEGVFQ